MKTIKLDHITYNRISYSKTSRYPYSVAIGNGHSKNFMNLDKAKAFRAQCNRHYNQSLEDLVLISADVYSLYRKNWLYNDINCLELLYNFEKSLNTSISKQNYGNGPFYVCRAFMHSCECLMEICEKMMTKKQNRSMMNREASNYHQKIKAIKTKLKDFGKPTTQTKP